MRWPLTAACLAACALASNASVQSRAAAAASKARRAAEAYQHALRLRVALETHPARAPESYLRVAAAFRQVYQTDSAYAKTPAALAAAAEVYQEMGRRFTSDRYYSKAIEAYQFLAAQYPGSSLAVDAMYSAAEIYRNNLENPVAARDVYKQFLKRYPRARQTPDARRKIAAIDRQLARWPGAQPAAPGVATSSAAPDGSSGVSPRTAPLETVAVPDKGPNPAPLGSSSGGATGGLEVVESIRHWVGPSYTRVVIRLDGKAAFNAAHLEHPPRLVFDLSGTRLSPELARKVFPVQNGFLERIRVAQFQPTVTRVVLDVPQIEDFSVFSLPDPFRLVIDIHGGQKTLLARAAKDTAAATPAASTGATAYPATRAQPGAPLAAEPDGAVAPGDARTPAHGASQPPLPARSRPGAGSAAAPVSPNAGPATLAAPPAAAAPLDGESPTLTRALGLKIGRIVIDAGHGGHDTGTIGPSGLEEKNLVLDVGLRLRKLIERRMGCQVIMTRTTDAFIPLEERTAIANEYGADLFVSIHANSSPDPSARGIEIYYLNFTSDPEALGIAARENATSRESVYQLQSLIKKIALSEKIDESRQFAKMVDTRLVSYMDEYAHAEPNRGVKKAPFVVLIGANMPSILAEISFLSNPSDERLLRKSAYREKIAAGLYSGIVRYANSLGTLRVAQGAPPGAVQHDPPSF